VEKVIAELISFVSLLIPLSRSLRKDHFTLNGKVTMDEFAKLFQKQDLELPEHLLQEIVSKFRLSDEAANPILKVTSPPPPCTLCDPHRVRI
jgi:hypothetical protein